MMKSQNPTNEKSQPVYQPLYPQPMSYDSQETAGPVKRQWKLSRVLVALIIVALLNFGIIFAGDWALRYLTKGIMGFRAPELFMAAAAATVLMTFVIAFPGNKPLRWLKNLLRLPLLLFIFIVLWFYGLTYYAQDALLYMKVPYNEKQLQAVLADPAFERVDIRLGNNETIGGWFFRNVEETGPKPLLIYFGGNGQEATGQILSFKNNRSDFIEGYNVLIIDYPGYGLSSGQSGEENVYRYARQAYAFASQREDVDREHIVLGAWSLGTGTAIRLAAEVKPAGLILLAPYYSGETLIKGYATDMLGLKYLPPLPIRNPYKSYDYAPHYDKNVLLVTSTNDKMIRYTQSLDLAALFPNARVLKLDSTGHLGYWSAQEVQTAVKAYLAQLRLEKR